MNRHRLFYSGVVVVVVVLGLASRAYGGQIPPVLKAYAGDTLWSLMVFLLVGIVFSNLSTIYTALVALGISVLIEVSQLYHAEWIDSIRNSGIGGLVLGHGFLWSDMICYVVGCCVGVVGEFLWYRKVG